MCNCGRLIKAIDNYIKKADDDLSDALKAEGYAEPEKTVKYIGNIEDAVADALVNERDFVLKAASGAVDLETFAKAIWPGVKLTDELAEKLEQVFAEQLAEFMPEYVETYLKQTDKELILNEVSKKTTGWVKTWSKELGDIMKLNSHTEIESILTKGLDDGNSIAEFTQSILDSGIRDEYYKARRVAVTEVLRAHSVAQEEAIQQSPAVEFKEWRHTGSYRNTPRQNHIDMDGQVVPKKEPFTLTGANGGTYYPMYPRDSLLPPAESVNCHCIHRAVVNEDILGLSLEERKKLQQQAIDEMDDDWEKELNEKNKAKAGIDENHIDCDFYEKKDKAGKIKYIGGKRKWALYEAGLIANDEELENVRNKTLKELASDGIITIPQNVIKHSTIGEYTNSTKSSPNGRLKSGGHSVLCKQELDVKGIKYTIEKTYSNGVTCGGVDKHKDVRKRIGTGGQTWFPDDWTEDDVLVAGTAVVNSMPPAVKVVGDYNNVTIVVYTSADAGTICPDYIQDIEGVYELE